MVRVKNTLLHHSPCDSLVVGTAAPRYSLQLLARNLRVYSDRPPHSLLLLRLQRSHEQT